MEPVGSLLCSEEQAAGPYTEPDAFSPHLPTPFPSDTFQYYLPIYT
jgi:hypothetical protein